ncbi:HesA/MoeB/ThiF family protein [Abyssalbus ytuae]|uniref:Molybdopterin-synthase adenylyltransferase n=1 Tax=Abyssalbus ytuae TaxID=2926907 RepID=A0A9E7D3P4_9FLAO|nr:HesA/MoeB/ThiF family protein [Abyssalbus ytuae]UOB18069.1 HesA/MoeB/ThiF family protein [Abyssalbus ytuae]
MSKRYIRQTILPEVGEEGQQKINQAKVLVIGAGGLACAILPYLASAGIGNLGIIDDDMIDISNLQRQVIYKEKSVGKSKVQEAEKYLSGLNSNIKINTYHKKLTAQNAISLFKEYDIITDATDNLLTRYIINDACIITKKPFVYGSVHKFEGQVSVFNYKNGPTYRCLYPDNNLNIQNCAQTGVLGTTAAIVGMLQANEVIKIILNQGNVLSGKLLLYNTLDNEQTIINFQKNNTLVIDDNFYENEYLKNEVYVVTAEEALKKKGMLLDVREYGELPEINLPNAVQIPLSILPDELNKLNKKDSIFIFCQSGIRSLEAVKILKENHFNQVKSIKDSAARINELSHTLVSVK